MRFFNSASPCRPGDPEQAMLIAAECIRAQAQRLLPADERPASLDEVSGDEFAKGGLKGYLQRWSQRNPLPRGCPKGRGGWTDASNHPGADAPPLLGQGGENGKAPAGVKMLVKFPI